MAYGTGEKTALPVPSSLSSHGPSPSRTAASSRSFRQCTRLRLKNGSGIRLELLEVLADDRRVVDQRLAVLQRGHLVAPGSGGRAPRARRRSGSACFSNATPRASRTGRRAAGTNRGRPREDTSSDVRRALRPPSPSG